MQPLTLVQIPLLASEKKRKRERTANMNAEKAKQLDFRVLLEKMGYYPVQGGIRKGGKEIWYRSPLNKGDKTPSFHISKGDKVAWVFKCFSTGEQGTIIDFVNAHEGYSTYDIKPALAYLRGKFVGSLLDYNKDKAASAKTPFSSHQHTKQAGQGLAADRQLEYLEDLPLKSGQLLNYLETTRKIPRSLSQQYLRLVRYKNLKNQKNYFGIAMKNRAGGFEVRTGSDAYSFKSALIARDITIIEGKQKNKQLLVFEGMMDFLSYLVMSRNNQPQYDTVVLHSINSYHRCKQFITEQGYNRIDSFLDNDKAGNKCRTRFEEDFGKSHHSHAHKYLPHKDLNEALKAGKGIFFFPDTNSQNTATFNLDIA